MNEFTEFAGSLALAIEVSKAAYEAGFHRGLGGGRVHASGFTRPYVALSSN